VGATTQACGPTGSTCTRCSGGKTCKAGTCVAGCSRATCPDGCCKNGECKRGTQDAACGSGGGACTTCSGSKTCQQQRCKSGGGGGGCSRATCANGCCDGDTCVFPTSNAACGTDGAACVACGGSTPVCTAGTCSAGSWTYSTTFGTPGTGDSNISSPNDVALSPDLLTAWVVDKGNNRIVVWTRPDATSTAWSYSAQFGSFGTGNDNFSSPTGIFVSPDTLTAWVADAFNHRVVVWTRPDAASTTWTYSTQFGSQGSGDTNFENPTGIFVSEDTLTAWVADLGNHRIVIWTRGDASSTSWSYSAKFGTFGTDGSGDSNLFNPYSVFVSADALTMWIADRNNDRIAIWTQTDPSLNDWSYNAKFGTEGAGDSNLFQPYAVAASADGLTAWVSDTINNRIVIWTRPDVTSTTWSYSAQFGTNGSGDTNFAFPIGLFLSPDEQTLWVADSTNNRISIWAKA
jgi:sugar lactone lactonase YvrE